MESRKLASDRAANFLQRFPRSDLEGKGCEGLCRRGDEQPYVALSMPMTGPLRQACFYRFSLALRTQGSIHFCFGNIPLPRRNVTDLTGDWQTVSWDFFVDGPTCDGVPPTVQFGNDPEIRSASLKQIPPPPETLY